MDSTISQRRIVLRIIENIAKCRVCGDVIKSEQPELPYSFCTCGKVGVGGGKQSILRIGHHADIEELSQKEYAPNPFIKMPIKT